MNKSSIKKSSKDTNSQSIDARLALYGFQRSKSKITKPTTKSNQSNNNKDNNNNNNNKKKEPKFFIVDTFDAANPLDHLKGEYGSDRLESMTEQQLANYVIKQASLISFPDKETPEQVEDEKEIKRKFEAKGIQVSDDFRDPYDYTTKLRFHDAGRHNGMVKSILHKMSMYAVGTDFPHIILDVNRSFPDKDMEKEELMKMNYSFVYYRIRNELGKMDKKVDLRKCMIATIINAFQYGRACHLIQDDKETELPISLKCLASMRLGRVYTNSLDWDSVEGIHYPDFKKDQAVIFKENMIYAVNENYHQSPNSYNYGYSKIEPVKYLVELNTIIDSMDFKQLNKRSWSPLLIIQTDSDDKQAVALLRDAYKRFTSVFTTIPHTHEQIPVDHGGEFLLKEREANDVKIANDMGMPLILLGKELPNTKATASQLLQAFNNTTAKDIRIWLRSIFEPQWYGRNIIKIVTKLYDEFKSGEKDSIVEEEREIFDKYIEKAKEKKKNEIKALIRKSPLYMSLANAQTLAPPEPEPEPKAQTTTRTILRTDPKTGKQIEDQEEVITSQKTKDELSLEEEDQRRKQQGGVNQSQQNNLRKEVDRAEEQKDQQEFGKPNTDLTQRRQEEDRDETQDRLQNRQEQNPAEENKLLTSLELIDSIIDERIEQQFKELMEDEQKTFDKLIQYDEPEDLPFKVKVAWDIINFDTRLETAAYVTGLLEKEVMDMETAQDELDLEQMIEKTKLEQEAQIIMEEILIQLKVKFQPGIGNFAGEGNNNNNNNNFGNNNNENNNEQQQQGNQEREGQNNNPNSNRRGSSLIGRGFQNQKLSSIRNRRGTTRVNVTGTT